MGQPSPQVVSNQPQPAPKKAKPPDITYPGAGCLSVLRLLPPGRDGRLAAVNA